MSSTYKFGVELELLLRLKKLPQDVNAQNPGRSDLIKVADYIVSSYNSKIRSNSSSGKREVKYPSMSRPKWERRPTTSLLTEWEVHNEPSMYFLGLDQCQDWPLEFASPVFDYLVASTSTEKGDFGAQAAFNWHDSIRQFFKVLQDEARLIINEDCSMQVSISCNDRHGWDNLDDLKSLSKTIVYFEGAIKSLMPEHRRENFYAKWNASPTKTTSTTSRSNFYFAQESDYLGCMRLIDHCHTVNDLVELMNNGEKGWSWDFEHIDPDTMEGRVEFRSPPGVNNCEDCFAWIHFAIEFVHASIFEVTTLERLELFSRDFIGLASFLDSVPSLLSEDEKSDYREKLQINAAQNSNAGFHANSS